MGKGIAGLEAAYHGLFTAVLIVLAVLVILCLLRAIIGPRTADRIVSVNMMGTMVIVIIGILTVMMGEGYLADICIIYAMISFLAVIVLTKVYMGVYMEKKEAAEKEGQTGNGKSASRNTPGSCGQPERKPENKSENKGKSSIEHSDKCSGSNGRSSIEHSEKCSESNGKSSIEHSDKKSESKGKCTLKQEKAAREVSEQQNAVKDTMGQEG
jgi:multicomponent Na+:H+ antiporter subunit F